jgi:glycosyltransferase involved in cell wall biosynthesis
VSRDIPESQPTSPLTLLTVGNCGDVKNHTLLIEAIAQMKHREDIHYIHVGYAQAETEKEMRLAKELGIASQIEFAGSCDPYPYLARADVFVMTSRYEGLSIATLEAIFTGIPVLLADVPGLDEFKGKGLENVFYYKPEINALANALDDMADRHATGDLHRSRAQSERAAELYDCRRQALKYLEVWKDLTK